MDNGASTSGSHHQESHGASRLLSAVLPGVSASTLAGRSSALPLCLRSSQLRALHSSASAAAAAGEGAGTSREAPSQQQQASGSAAAPVRNPMQAALEAALAERREAAEAGQTGLTEASAAAAAIRGWRQPRTWMWYDEKDEREERAKERRRFQYDNAGVAHMLDAPQSMKKMNRIVKLVRGLSYSEALAQCQLVPHKAAMYVRKALEKAYEDATDKKGLDGDKLLVRTIFVTKGVYEKGMQPMGKGASGRMVKRKSHVRVVLTESRGSAGAFTPRVVAPLMTAWSKTAPARWLARAGASEGSPVAARQRFAYRLEV